MGLDIVELFAEVEDEFGVEIPDAVAATMTTVGQLFDYIEEHSPAGRDAGAWDRFIAVVSRETGIEPSDIYRDSRFVQDLRMD